MDNNIKQLPFWETIGRSFKYVFKNISLLKAVLPVIGILVVVQMIFNFPMMCSFGMTQYCKGNLYNNIQIFITAVAACGVIINYCRSIICKANVDYLSGNFFKRLGLYFIASICLSVFIGIPTFIVTILGAVLGFNEVYLQILIYLTFFGFGIFFAPLLVVFPAVAVDDYKIINWARLFSMVKQNHLAVFFGQMLVMVPYWLLYRTLLELYFILGFHNYIANLLFTTIFISLAIMDACIKGAFFAHIYQFFKFYDKHK